MMSKHLDGIFSDFIRTRDNWQCQNEECGKQFTEFNAEYLDCSHYVRRAVEVTRFDPQNAVALCRDCHRYFTEHSKEHTEWFKNRIGEEQFDALILKSNTQVQFLPDRREISRQLRAELARMNSVSVF